MMNLGVLDYNYKIQLLITFIADIFYQTILCIKS